MPNYSSAWDETIPSSNEAVGLGDDRIRSLKAQIRERLATEHTNISSESGDAKLLHLPGKTSVLYYGTTAQINALTGMSEGAVAFDTTLGALKVYTGGAWTVLPFDWDGMWGAGSSVHNHTSDAQGGALLTLKFLANPVRLLSQSGLFDWTDVDISTYTGSDTAKAAYVVMDLYFGGAGDVKLTALLRKKGSTETSILPRLRGMRDAYHAFDLSSCTAIVECDTNEVFQVKLQADTGSPSGIEFKVDLIGYFI